MFAGIFLVVVYCWLIVVAAIENGSRMRKPSITKNTKIPKQIPLSIIMELNQVSDISELLTKFLPNEYVSLASVGIQGRSGLSQRRGSDVLVKSAGCSIENKTISLKDTNDTSLYYYPACTRVTRCGGCCSHELLSCQPTKTETINVNVKVFQYVDDRKFIPLSINELSIEQHLKCMCQCIIKKEDCIQFQSYDHKECRCMCNNEEDHEKCSKEHNLKIWNPATCTCECRDTEECTEGLTFDYNACRCKSPGIIQRNTTNGLNRNSYSQISRRGQPYTTV